MKEDAAAKEAVNLIQRYNTFLISSHINVEGDALGSELALKMLLQRLGKKAYVINDGETPEIYNFFPGVRSVRAAGGRHLKYDACIVVDCPALERIGKSQRLIDKRRPLLCIDHHKSNLRFGTVNWVDTSASCAGEMIYELFGYFGLAIEKEAATLLYAAILMDTGSFRYSNTSSRTHLAAGRLIEAGADPAYIAHNIYEANPFRKIRLMGSVLSTAKRAEGGKIVYMELTRGMLKDAGANIDDIEGFVECAASIKDAQMIIFFKEYGAGEIGLSFRSRGYIDVDRFARRFGGGGHKGASGCLIKGDMGAVKKKVLSIASKQFGR